MSRLSDAAAAIPMLTGFCHPGLQALTGADAAHVSAAQPRTITHTLALDQALQPAAPGACRWDYGVGKFVNPATEELVWVEVHPASGGSSLHEIRAKACWLKTWLSGAGRALDYKPKRLVWVASGRSSFSRTDPKLRALNELGIQFVGGHLSV